MIEAELKLLLSPTDAPRLKDHHLLKRWGLKRPYTRVFENRYFDTPELTLASQGIALRLRSSGQRWWQTLKAGNISLAGLHTRSEWELPVAGPRLEWARLLAMLPADAPWAAQLARVDLRRRLAPRVYTRFKRRIWNLETPGGDRIECALDLGEIEAAGQRLPIAEVELELKHGKIYALHELALALTSDLPLRLGALGKAERGYALLAPRAVGAVGAGDIELDPAGGIGAALAAIVAGCLAQIEANEPGLSQFEDPECLHQTRVGLRRLRAALKLFTPFAALPEAWASEVRWAAGVLGPARDGYVLAEGTLARLPGTATGGELACLRDRARAYAATKQREALLAFDLVRHARWRIAVMAWALKQQERPSSESLEAWAWRVIGGLVRRLNRRARNMQAASAQQRHAARIAAKQLRYALEFFSPLLDQSAGSRAVRRLARLQDALGLINDAAVARRLLAELVQIHPELDRAAAWAEGWLAADRESQAARLESFWKPTAKALRKLKGSD